MADVQTKIEIATLGTREEVVEVAAVIAVTDTADTVHQIAVVFDKPYVRPPVILGAVTIDTASAKGIASVEDVTAVGMTVNLYQIGAGDLATQDHNVRVSFVGWKTK